jgi:ribosome-binding protein aMBF1 (putative translation factor)
MFNLTYLWEGLPVTETYATKAAAQERKAYLSEEATASKVRIQHYVLPKPGTPSLASALGDRLYEVRMGVNVSQVELARRVNTTQPQIARYETGAQVMNVARLYEVAAALGVHPSRLLI